MKTFITPVCPETKKDALMFCYTPTCSLPAFGCSQDCLANHASHDYRPWLPFEQFINSHATGKLSPEQIKALEQEEKQILILTSELKNIQLQHEKSMRDIKLLLKIREIGCKILDSIQSRATDQITGCDMAQFIKLIEANNLFANQKLVTQALSRRTELINKTLTKVSGVIEQYKSSLIKLSKLEDFPTKDELQIDIKSLGEELIIQNSRVLTVRAGFPQYRAIFLNHQLTDSNKFEVEVVDVGDGNFTIGVATNALRAHSDRQKQKGSFCIHASGAIYSDSYRRQTKFKIVNGDRITVSLQKSIFSWFRDGEVICSTQIPEYLYGYKFFPVCWIRSNFTPSTVAKVRFL